jgi:hypothetical protein
LEGSFTVTHVDVQLPFGVSDSGVRILKALSRRVDMTWCKSLTFVLVLSLVFLLGVKVGDPDSREQITTWLDGWSAWYAEREGAREADELETLPFLAAQCEAEARGIENYGILVLTGKTGWIPSRAMENYQNQAKPHNTKIANTYEPLWRKHKDKCPSLTSPSTLLVPANAPSPKNPVTDQKK